MYQVAVIGCSIIVGLSVIVDPSGTLKLVTTVITVRGITWVIKKVIESVKKDYADIINLAGWSIAGIAMIKIVKNAKGGIDPLLATVGKVGEVVNGIGNIFDRILEIADKIAFWN